MRSARTMLRPEDTTGRVTQVELFFDLVFVFAITQVSHALEERPTPDGALQAAILLGLVWQVWVYTTWATTFVDPQRLPVRTMLVLSMLGSLVLAASLPEAFTSRGLAVALTFTVMQVGRAIFLVVVLRGDLRGNFLRVLTWSTVSGVLMIVGGVEHGHARELLWVLAIAVDVVGAALGFVLPGAGRSRTEQWTIDGGHFAERCQAFVLIAIGESIVVTGSRLAGVEPSGTVITAFVAAFLGSVALWWVYFDRAAEDSSEVIRSSDDPGRLGRSAFHWVHPLIIGGIVVSAAADAEVLAHPGEHLETAGAWFLLGGPALFLFGHAVFKLIVWRIVPWTRLAGAVVLLALVPLHTHATAITLGVVVLAVVVVVALSDRMLHPAVD